MKSSMQKASGLVAAVSVAVVMASASASAAGFELKSAEFADGDYLANEQVFAGFGCEGKNTSPSLSWSGAPADTKSFALNVYDPDAPTGSGWWHWVVVNMPPTTTGLQKGAGASDGSNLPQGAIQVRTDFGAPAYGGPCPPQGDHPHRYIFTIYALDLESLDVTADSSAALVGFYLNFHTLAKASLMGFYKR